MTGSSESTSSGAVRLARVLDRVLDGQMARRIGVWAVLSHLFIVVAAFLADFGNGGAVVSRWWPGWEEGAGGVQSFVEMNRVPYTVAALSFAAGCGALVGWSLRKGGSGRVETALMAALVLPPWGVHGASLARGELDLALALFGPAILWTVGLVLGARRRGG